MEYDCIFPTTIGIKKLERELTSEEVETLNNLPKRESDAGNIQSIDSKILKIKKLQNLYDFIDSSLNEYYQTVYCPKDSHVEITQSWVNYSTLNHRHGLHNHPNSFLSGVFYANAEESADCILFHKNFQESIVDIPSTKTNIYNAKVLEVGVKTGMLIIFPSGLWHQVPRISTERFRVSISFNSFVVGTIGDTNLFNCLSIKGID